MTVTVGSAGKQVGSVEAVVRRKEYGAPYAEPASIPPYPELPKAQRTPWLEMERLVDGFYTALNAHDGHLPKGLDPACQWNVNGQALAVDGGLSSSHPVTKQEYGRTAV